MPSIAAPVMTESQRDKAYERELRLIAASAKTTALQILRRKSLESSGTSANDWHHGSHPSL